MTQPALWDDEPEESRPVPSDARCRMCVRPARITASGLQLYCGGKACHNPRRICARCNGPFIIKVDGAGTKYCSYDCSQRPRASADLVCAWCSQPAPAGSESSRTRRPDSVWPYLCRPCLDPIWHLVDRLKGHRVPHELARRLLTDPGCAICGRDIIVKVRTFGSGKPRALLAVDHDHACCPGSKSCGRCVRGFLCPNCNSAAGLLGDDPATAERLVTYLKTRGAQAGP